MSDLFRFLLLRPAELPKPNALRPLVGTFFHDNDGPQLRRRQAADFVAKHAREMRAETLEFGDVAQAVASALAKGPVAASDLEAVVRTTTGDTTATLVGKDGFANEEQTLVDWLVALKLVSGSFGTDAAGLAKLAQGYDAIGQLAAGRDPVALRPLYLPDAADKATPAAAPEPGKWSRVAAPPAKADAPVAVNPAIVRLDRAIAALSNLPTASFHAAQPAAPRPAAPAAPTCDGVKGTPIVASATSVVGRAWLLNEAAIRALPAEATGALHAVGLDPTAHAVPELLNALHAARTTLLQTQALHELSSGAVSVTQVGNSFQAWSSNDYVGRPAQSMPTGHGTISPVGLGDLLMVREHVLRYEGGDLAHVENVLKSETLSRDTRRLERTETTILQESETTKEQTRDTQTTDRFSLKRETSDTIKSDSSFKAGVSVDAKYGPFVEVKANADFATSSSSESSAKQASEFSKDVVDRSISKVVERVLERRTTTTIEEFEEKYLHSFTNVGDGAKHISGMYQWIDKIMRAQVYNYGKRMLFDITVPEPATEYVITQSGTSTAEQALVKPVPFTINALQITEGNYAAYAKLYDVTGLEPPPPPVKTISKGLDAAVVQDPHESSKSFELPIDDGYVARHALFERHGFGWDGHVWSIVIGSNTIDAWATAGYYTLNDEISSVPVAYMAYKVELLAVTIEIYCERTDRALDVWRLKVHGAITQGYQAKQQAYEQALAQARAAAGVQISGRNPAFNQRLIANELRKQCLTLLTAQQFDAFGALELSSQGYAQPNLARTAAQMPYVRFFEQAFEWEHIVYFFYPYFWGWKNSWAKRMLLDDVDPDFADFLRAGAGRVVFPVRPGFEAAVIHYLDTGEIWNGGPPPDISSSLYVPIVTEIAEAEQRPGDEVPVGDPWLVTLPTTLVRIRPNDDLPTWEQVGGEWQATN